MKRDFQHELTLLLRVIHSALPELTTRQMALMIMIHKTNGPHRVRHMAQKLGVRKPVITRAINSLEGLGFVRRMADTEDKRDCYILPTVKGNEFLDKYYPE